MLRSAIHSSRLEILTSKRFTTGMYALFGVAIALLWAVDCIQFVDSYYSIREFDVSVTDFLMISFLFQCPLVVLGAFMLSVVLQRFRLRRWFESRLHITQYTAGIKPAEAGLLVDYEFSLEEIHAMLLDLHFRSNIDIEVKREGVDLKLNHTKNVSTYEASLLHSLFEDGNKQITLTTLNDGVLVAASQDAHDGLVRHLSSKGVLPTWRRPNKKFQTIMRVVFMLGGFIGLFEVMTIVFMYDIVSTVMYPRFPVEPAELYSLVLVSLIGIGVIFTGFWPRFDSNYRGLTSAAWLEAEGFRQYLRTVIQPRMDERSIKTQDMASVKLYLPYLVAFKLVKLTPNLLTLVSVRS